MLIKLFEHANGQEGQNTILKYGYVFYDFKVRFYLYFRYVQVLFTMEEKDEVFSRVHSVHGGVAKTTKELNKNYYWPNSTHEIKEKVWFNSKKKKN